MIAALAEFADRLLGRGDATITVPSFDGALKPNQILEKAETVAQFDAPEDLATDGKALYVADGAAILRLDGAAHDRGPALRPRRSPRCAACPTAAWRSRSTGARCRSLRRRRRRVRARPFADPAMNAINALAPGPAER